jgi:hypothetical protein
MKNTLKKIDGINYLNEREMLDTFGGGWWSDFKEGFVQGWNWAVQAATDTKSTLKKILGIK